MSVTTTRHGATVLLTMDNAPVNALSTSNGHLDCVSQALDTAINDPHCQTIVMTGAGAFFCAGADIAEFETGSPPSDLRRLIEQVDASTKPVIMAINGMALGGGLILAMAGQVRLANKDARVGLPAAALGLLPAAGGTQLLPRLIGAAAALPIMISGRQISAQEALALGLVDLVVDGDVVIAALALAASIDLTPRRTSALPVPDDVAAAVAAARAQDHCEASAAMIACVERMSDDFTAGLDGEDSDFIQLVGGEASRALRYVFLGERLIARIPCLPRDQKRRTVKTVGVIGAGAIGGGIAQALLDTGLEVILVEEDADALSRMQASISEADSQHLRLTCSKDYEALALADLVIEAGCEDTVAKRAVFQAVESVVRADAILVHVATSWDLDALAQGLADPSRLVGLHFVASQNESRVLEVVRSAHTAPDVLASVMALGKRLGKVAIVSGASEGLIVNRMLSGFAQQVMKLRYEGVAPQQIDAALEAWGFAKGAVRALVQAERSEQAEPQSAEALLAPRMISDEEIVECCLLALINEGLHIVGDGIAYRPVDIDMACIHGLGFPRKRGGPLFQADEFGAAALLQRIVDNAAPLIRQMAAKGEPFSTLNA